MLYQRTAGPVRLLSIINCRCPPPTDYFASTGHLYYKSTKLPKQIPEVKHHWQNRHGDADGTTHGFGMVSIR